MRQFHESSRIKRHSIILMSALLSLNCTGCTGGDTSSANGNSQRATELSNIAQLGSDKRNQANPPSRTSSNQEVSAAAGSRPEGTPRHLQAEAELILNDGISSQAASDILRSRLSISDAIDRMTQNAAADPDAQDLTRHYRSALIRALGENGALDDFSCGLSICIGIARSRGIADHETWERSLASDPSSPTYSYAESSEEVEGRYESRFIFSTDPALNSISGN